MIFPLPSLICPFSATALFFFPFSSDLKTKPAPTISSLDLGRPVVDFFIDASGRIWALVDGETQTAQTTGASDDRLVRLLKFSDGKVC